MAHLCGAKTRNGSPCKSKAMANGRCRMHGGASKGGGAPKGNKNSVKAGSIYSKYMTEEEQELATQLELGTVDDELRLTRIRLLRVLALEDAIDKDDEEAELQIETKSVEPILLGGMVDNEEEPITKKTYRRRDFSGMVDRLVGRIESLESRRSALLNDKINIELKREELTLKKKAVEKEAGSDSGSIQTVMVVPAVMDVSGWEKAAQEQQEELLVK